MLYVWIFIISLVASAIVVPWVLIKLPHDYFCPNKKRREPFARFPAAARMPLIVMKNILGALLVAAGLVFLVMPGQGVIVILIGVLLLDFPRKRELERWLIARGPILKLSNWIRAKGHKKPLQL